MSVKVLAMQPIFIVSFKKQYKANRVGLIKHSLNAIVFTIVYPMEQGIDMLTGILNEQPFFSCRIKSLQKIFDEVE